MIHVTTSLFAYGTGVEWGGLVVVDSHLHHHEEDGSHCKAQIGYRHEQRNGIHAYGYENKQERNNQKNALQIVLGSQHIVETFFPDHQSIDIVAFECHDTTQRHQSQYTVAIQTDEIVHVAVVAVNVTGKSDCKHTHDEEEAPELAAGCFVAEQHFQFQTQVFSYIAIAVEKIVTADMLDLDVFCPRKFFVDVVLLY